jgi:hypothetical protein
MAGIGHNAPPSMVDTAGETMRDISAWLSENVVITEDTAKEAKVYVDRGKLALKDLDDERDSKVRPLNERVKEINDYYRPAKETLTRTLDALGERVSEFLKEEKRKREEAAREAARIAEDAERKAREAERLEQEALGSNSSGELGVDIAAHVVEADNAFRDFEKAQRAALLAERETRVRIGGGFSRAIGLKKKETLTVTDVVTAIEDLGHTKDIDEAIIKGARAYRKLHGKLPNGVESTFTEEI